jgi:hypothetical protein
MAVSLQKTSGHASVSSRQQSLIRHAKQSLKCGRNSRMTMLMKERLNRRSRYESGILTKRQKQPGFKSTVSF